MGFSFQGGQVIFRSQSVLGTYQADTGAAGISSKLRSGTLGPNRDLLVPDPEIGGGRDVVDAYLGAASWSGDYELYARVDTILTLLRAALGNASAPVAGTGATAGVQTYTLTPTDTASLPYLSIEERIGAGLESFRYTDAVVNTFHLEADANGYLMCTAGLIGAKQVAGVTISTPSASQQDNTPLIVGTNIGLQYGGVSLPGKSFSIDINNNFEDDDFRLGSFYLGDLTPKRREITASFSVRHGNSALWRQAVYGAQGAAEVTGLTTKQALVINCATYEDITGAAVGNKYNMNINIPKYTVQPFSFDPSGDDISESDISGQAMRPAIGTPIMTAAIATGRTAIA